MKLLHMSWEEEDKQELRYMTLLLTCAQLSDEVQGSTRKYLMMLWVLRNKGTFQAFILQGVLSMSQLELKWNNLKTVFYSTKTSNLNVIYFINLNRSSSSFWVQMKMRMHFQKNLFIKKLLKINCKRFNLLLRGQCSNGSTKTAPPVHPLIIPSW